MTVVVMMRRAGCVSESVGECAQCNREKKG